MRQFKTVLKFEYMNYLKSKTFIIITGLLAALVIVFAFFPQISGFFSGIFKSDSDEVVESLSIAFYDSTGVYDEDILNDYSPDYQWTKLSSGDDLENLIESEEYDAAVYFGTEDIDVYESGSASLYSNTPYIVEDAAKYIREVRTLSDAGLTDAQINDFFNSAVTVNTIAVGKDTSESFWVSYVIIFVLYFALIFYGSSIGTSVITEKTSKAMELLVTSAKPSSLIFGKVFGVGLAGLTQLGSIIVIMIVLLTLNINTWISAYPLVGVLLQNSLAVGTLVYSLIFFFLGFFSFAFIYAALSSTVSRIEDSNSVTTIPTLLLVVAFMASMSGLSNPEASYIQILSYVPFTSPMVMLMRICTLDVPALEIIISIGVNILYILLLGFISTRIYRTGIMLYGNKPKIKDLLSYIKG